MDNCGGQEFSELPGLRIELLSPKSTNKFRTSGLGLLANSIIRYRTAETNHIQVMLENIDAFTYISNASSPINE